ncbi:MAG TPA: hypothetical protein VLD18_16690, partial [Verrucomicrobiae bacterium]|nr:hypothetical protein [Verrucomicrobiae bacterium]
MVMPAVLSRTANWPGIASLLFAGAAIPLVTALGAFGREFAAGTFSSMLALPVSRGRLWGTKVLVLASALASFFCLWWISFRICAARWPELGYEAANNNLTPLSSGLFLLTAFSSGLWSTLVFR